MVDIWSRKKVMHAEYGEGEVRECKDGKITVYHKEYGYDRCYEYPAAFEDHTLTTEDALILSDVSDWYVLGEKAANGRKAVFHKRYGDGKITEYTNGKIKVSFAAGIKTFRLFDAFDGILKTDDPELNAYLEERRRKELAAELAAKAAEEAAKKAWAEKMAASAKAKAEAEKKEAEKKVLTEKVQKVFENIELLGEVEERAREMSIPAEEYRGRILKEMGCEADGTKVYDLGSRTVSVKIGDDLKCTFMDRETGKVTKSLPKKNSDPEKYELAKADFAIFRRRVSEIRKYYHAELIDNFLDGDLFAAGYWRNVYLFHPVLKQLARLLVWDQGGCTFTVRDGQTIRNNGSAYVLSDEPVKLAHPIEMIKEDIAAWQEYFISNHLSQPFAQIWEAVCPNLRDIKPDRYARIPMSLSEFKGERYYGIGIDYDLEYYAGAYEVTDYHIRIKGVSCMTHKYKNTSGIVIDKFYRTQAYTSQSNGKLVYMTSDRRFNHYITYFDKCTIKYLIMKDDISIAYMLPEFTAAQITDFITLAIENNCVNVTAMLMEYKQEHFPVDDPFAEFVLDLDFE